jgi:hypothetical protein
MAQGHISLSTSSRYSGGHATKPEVFTRYLAVRLIASGTSGFTYHLHLNKFLDRCPFCETDHDIVINRLVHSICFLDLNVGDVVDIALIYQGLENFSKWRVYLSMSTATLHKIKEI